MRASLPVALLDLAGQPLADAAEPHVPEGVEPLSTVAFSPPSGVRPLGDDEDRRVVRLEPAST